MFRIRKNDLDFSRFMLSLYEEIQSLIISVIII